MADNRFSGYCGNVQISGELVAEGEKMNTVTSLMRRTHCIQVEKMIKGYSSSICVICASKCTVWIYSLEFP